MSLPAACIDLCPIIEGGPSGWSAWGDLIAHGLSLAAIEWSVDRRVVRANSAAIAMFGYSLDEIDGVDFLRVVHPPEDSDEFLASCWDNALHEPGGKTKICETLTKSGVRRITRWFYAPLLAADGSVRGLASFVEDITEREQFRRAMLEREALIEGLTKKLPALVWAIDDRGVPLYWSEYAEKVLGYPAAEVVGNPKAVDIVVSVGAGRPFVRDDWAGGLVPDFDHVETSVRAADGRIRQIAWTNLGTRCPVAGWHAWGIGIDISDLRHAEASLAEAEGRFRTIFDNLPVVGLMFDRQQRIVYCNEHALRVTGWTREAMIGRHCADLLSRPEDRAPSRARFAAAMRGEPFPRVIDCCIVTAAGEVRTLFWVREVIRNAAGEIEGAVALGTDVTEQRLLEDELELYRERLEDLVRARTAELIESSRRLAVSERLAALGEIAAGVGHDIGNILLPLRCHMDALVAGLGGEREEAVRGLRSGLSLLGDLVVQLSALARDGVPPADEARSCDLAEWWSGFAPLAQDSIAPGIKLSMSGADAVPPVGLPPSRLSQVMLNLLVNASDSIVARAPRTGQDAVGHIDVTISGEPAGCVTLRVHDDGAGLPPGVAERAAEPFFTTKPRGRGTGLGLATVQGIVERGQGQFALAAGASGGAVATIVLPIASALATTPRPLARLLIDDPRVASLHAQLAEASGFAVAPPASGVSPALLIVDDVARVAEQRATATVVVRDLSVSIAQAATNVECKAGPVRWLSPEAGPSEIAGMYREIFVEVGQ